MGYTTDLLEGLAEHLAGAGIGVWDTDAAYTAAQVGIVLDVVPQDPPGVIVLSGYSVTDDPSLSDTVTGVQIRTRAGSVDPRPTDDIADQIFDQLHGAQDLDLNGIRVQLARRTSWTPLGPDQNRRHERSDNYYLTTHRPSPHRQ